MTASQTAARVLATWFGCGYFPWGPGTIGSGAALLLAVGLARYAGAAPWWFGLLALGVLPLSIWASGVEALTSGLKDPQHVVVDEVVGQWITLAPVAVLDTRSVLLAFVFFRVFDIAKPAPARQMEALPGGLGIVADDVMAGLYGAVVMACLRWVHF